MAIAYLNGGWGAPAETRVSVLDRGFMFGDGVYEVIAVYNGKPFLLEAHFARLRRSLEEINLESPCNDSEFERLIQEGIQRSHSAFATVYLQITRGADDCRDHIFPDTVRPTVFLMVTEAPYLENRDVTPIGAVTLEDFRWGMGHIKSVCLLANGLLRNQAISKGVGDAILIRDGFLTEATASNVFIVKGGVILTPPKTNYLLHGITRDQLVILAEDTQRQLQETQVSESDLRAADEIWITSTTNEICPVGKLDGKSINDGNPGPVFKEMDEHFQDLKHRYCGLW